jgi:ubiquinone/menaquinone biosynthesis C-methylase UbiE
MHADWATDETAGASRTRSWNSRRECRSVCRALARVPSGASVLDIPCGDARWLTPLVNCGYRVTCADSSELALASASQRWQQLAKSGVTPGVAPTFVLCRLPQTAFPDRHFDAVVCTRFFDELDTSERRIEALRELRRVSRGPVIVSFCNAFALGALRISFASGSKHPEHQPSPVPVWAFLNDLRRAGLKPVKRHAVLWGISPLWHVVSVPFAGRATGLLERTREGASKAA